MKAPSGEKVPEALFRTLSLFSPFLFLPLLSEKISVTAQNVNKIIKFTILFIRYTKKELLPGKGTGDGRKLHV